MNIKTLRKSLNLTQLEASKITKIPLRTYINYENDDDKTSSIKYHYIFDKLTEYGKVTEEKGILTIEKIKNVVHAVLESYTVDFCYLFGSYATGDASDNSDVDLLISSSVKGLNFYGLIEELRTNLHKKVDLLTTDQLKDNQTLINDILKEGLKIYG